jgi:hypothetical protein
MASPRVGYITNCGHNFHGSCLKTHMEFSVKQNMTPTCPICRVGIDKYKSLSPTSKSYQRYGDVSRYNQKLENCLSITTVPRDVNESYILLIRYYNHRIFKQDERSHPDLEDGTGCGVGCVVACCIS